MVTYAQYQAEAASEKIVLAWLEPMQRLFGWTIGGTFSGGAGYSRVVDKFVVGVRVNGVELTQVNDSNVYLNQYFYDAASFILYVGAASDPSSAFTAARFRVFVSNSPLVLPWDMASGRKVVYESLISSTSEFGFELDGEASAVALESQGEVTLTNDGSFKAIFEGCTWENQAIRVFSYSKTLDTPAQALTLFQGNITSKSYSPDSITFTANNFVHQLRANVPLPLITQARVSAITLPSEFSGLNLKIAGDQVLRPIKRVYGRSRGIVLDGIDKINGDIPLPNFTLSASEAKITYTGAPSASPRQYVQVGDTIVWNGLSRTVVSLDKVPFGLDKPETVTLTANGAGSLGLIVSFASPLVVPAEVIANPTRYNVAISQSDTIHRASSFLFNVTAATSTSLTLAEGSSSTGAKTTQTSITVQANEIVIVKKAAFNTDIYLSASFSSALTDQTVFLKTDRSPLNKNRVFQVAHHTCQETSTDSTLFVGGVVADAAGIAEAAFSGLSTASTVYLCTADVVSTANLRVGDVVQVDLNNLASPFNFLSTSAAIIKSINSNRIQYYSNFNVSLGTLNPVRYRCLPLQRIDGRACVAQFDASYATYKTVTNNNTDGFIVKVADDLETNGIVPAVEKYIRSNIISTSGSNLYFSHDQKFGQLVQGDWVSGLGFVTEVFSDNVVAFSSTGATSLSSITVQNLNNLTNDSVLTGDVIGKTKNGLSNGELITTAADIVRDVLVETGVAVNETTFTAASTENSDALGYVLPKTAAGDAPSVRSVIDDMCVPILANVYDTGAGAGMSVLSYSHPVAASIPLIDDNNAISYAIQNDSSIILQTLRMSYDFRQFNTTTSDNDYSAFTEVTSLDGANLGKQKQTAEFDYYSASVDAAAQAAARLILANSRGTTTFAIQTTIEHIGLKLNDVVALNFATAYNKPGSATTARLGRVIAISNNGLSVNLTVQDPGGMFSRVGTIADNADPDFSAATAFNKSMCGFVTDDFGMIVDDNDAGANLII